MKRMGRIVKLRPEVEQKYREIHVAVWPEVVDLIRECGIRNYSIFLRDGLLFSYFEYHGSDYAADCVKMAASARMQEWWKITDPMQTPVESATKGDWWSDMEEVFHTE